jgi:polar amino acid transport system substrate-binding protein
MPTAAFLRPPKKGMLDLPPPPPGNRRRTLRMAAAALAGLLLLAAPAPARDLVLGTSYSPPYSTPDQRGVLDTVLREAFRRLGLEIGLLMAPAERCLRDAHRGAIDGVVARIRGMSRMYPNLVLVPEPTIESRQFVAFTTGPAFATTGWQSLAPYQVGMVKGWKIFEVNVKEAAGVLKVDSTRQLFRLLGAGRIQVALNARLDGLVVARELGIQDVKVLEPPLAEMRMYLHLHRRHAGLAPRLAEVLAAMKAEGSFARLQAEAVRRFLDR